MNNVNDMTPIASSSRPEPSPPAEQPRKKRTRAKRSCDKCRVKKTRCDAYIRQPCTKCKLSNSSCTFLVEQKKRGPSSGNYVEVLENRLLRMEKLLKNITGKQSDTITDDSDKFERESSTSSTNNNDNTGYMSNNDTPTPNVCRPRNTSSPTRTDDNDRSTPNMSHNICTPISSSEESINQQLQNLTISDYERTRYIGASSGIHFLDEDIMKSHTKRRVSDDPSWFVQKLNDEGEEHIFMKSKEIESPTLDVVKNMMSVNRAGAFEDVPFMTQDFLDYLVYMYFTRIHPVCPILNKIQFLEQYYSHTPTPPDKYIMYTLAYNMVTLFKSDILEDAIFHFSEQQFDQLTDALKTKSHRLLSFVYKRSMISTVQALIMLSMVVKFDCNDEEDTSHWLVSGMAIRMAQDLGLHRDCSTWAIPDYEIETRKRIWYCAYLMDRFIATDLGRPVSIIDNEFEVGLPSPFELTYRSKLVEQKCDYVPLLIMEAEEARQHQVPVYSSFVHLVTLAQLLGQVVIGMHSPKAKQMRYHNLELVDILDKNLANWKMSLPRELQVDTNNVKDYVSTAAATVNMMYCCALLLLYRPFIIENSSLAFKALSVCTSAATSILHIAENMDHDYFIALPWNMSVYCTFQAAIIFLHNAKGGNAHFKEHGKQHLFRCTDIYASEPFFSTNRVVKILDCIVNNFAEPLGEIYSSRSVKKNRRRPNSTAPTMYTTTTYDYLQPQYMCKLSPTTVPLLHASPEPQPSEPQPSAPIEMTGRLTNVDKLVRDFSGTRPEDIFMSSLTLSLGHPNTSLPPKEPALDTSYPTSYTNRPFDSSSLHSKLPIWDLPSGVTWTCWESFLKKHTEQ